MVIMDSFRRLILPGLIRIGVNGRRPMITLRVSYRPLEDLMVRVPHHDPEHGRRVMAGSVSNRFMAHTALEP